MLEIIETELLLEEIKTDGHAPLKFLCATGDIYYCKYLISHNQSEINFLAYEFVANRLLKALDIPTPDVAIVKIAKGTLDKSIARINRRIREDYSCFGSKEIRHAIEYQEIQDFTKVDFNKLVNPEDIVKIAMFDLWVENTDRGRNFGDGINYNLLIEPNNRRQKIVAFDNAFIFGGVNGIGTFNSAWGVNTNNKLISTPFYKNIVKYIEPDQFLNIVDNLIPLLKGDFKETIENLIDELPEEWELSLNITERINNFLSDVARIDEIRLIMLQSNQ